MGGGDVRRPPGPATQTAVCVPSIRVADHTDDCLMVRYLALPDDDREWYPDVLGGRSDLCTCGANPGSNALLPELQDVVEELREHVEACEDWPRRRG